MFIKYFLIEIIFLMKKINKIQNFYKALIKKIKFKNIFWVKAKSNKKVGKVLFAIRINNSQDKIAQDRQIKV